jgi:hypothetical protein
MAADTGLRAVATDIGIIGVRTRAAKRRSQVFAAPGD